VIGEATAAFTIAKGLPNAYNLDLQVITPHLWRALDDATSSVSLMAGMLASARFQGERLKGAVTGDMSTATELANELVRAHGVPFRQAHQTVGELVRIAVEKQMSLEESAYEFLGEVSKKVTGRAIKIDKARLRAVLDALKTLMLIGSAGGANPKFAKQQVVQNKKEIEKLGNWLEEKENKLNESRTSLRNEVRPYLKREVRS
jgi:argininosuccinate lyase